MNKKYQHLDLISKVGIFAGSLLATSLAVYFYSPAIKTHAYNNESRSGASDSIQVGVFVDPYIGIAVDKETLELSAAPNTFVSGPVDVYVTTNSYLGHTLTIEDVDSNTNLVHENANIQDAFTSAFDGAKTSSTMADKNWGFSVDGMNFYKIPVHGMSTLINKTDDSSPEDPGYDTKTVNFGAKVSMNSTSGTYSDIVLFTAYVNTQDGNVYETVNGEKVRVPVYKMGGTTQNMQNFDCELMEIGQTLNTTDLRDGNVYSVGRLPDGKCWMRQNLRLTDYTLTPEDSDVTSNFVLKASNISDFDVDEFDNSNPRNNAVYYKDNNYGAYYSWYTATVGSVDVEAPLGSSTSGGTLQSSVCPKGWRLVNDYEFYYLANAMNPDSGGTVERSTSSSWYYIPDDYQLLNLTPSGVVENGTLYLDSTESDFHTSDFDVNSDRNVISSDMLHTSSDLEKTNINYANRVYGQGLPVRCLTGIGIPIEHEEAGHEM